VLDVDLTASGRRTAVSVTGSSAEGRRQAPPEYVARCVDALTDELKERAGHVETWGQRWFGGVEGSAPFVAAFLMALSAGFGWGAAAFSLLGAAFLATLTSPGLQLIRRSRAGLFRPRDAVRMLADVVGVTAVAVGYLALRGAIF